MPDATYHPLSSTAGIFAQDWTNTGSITANNSWSGVPSIEGFSGAGLASPAGKDPQTIVTTGGSLIVTANQSNPDTLTPGGIAEFDGISDRTVALAGDSVNQAPHLVIYLDTRGTGDIAVSYRVRDVDASNRSSVSQVALQYRVSATGNFAGIDFTNVPAGFVSDATAGGTNTTSTTRNVPLPAAANNQQFVQLRFITADAQFGGGQTSDEWVGIDDILVDGNLPPVISLDPSQLDYIENAGLVPIDSAMALSDPDSSDFNGGVLRFDYTATVTADDNIKINNQGTGIGQISTSGTVAAGLSVRFTTSASTTTIGTANANGGKANTPLIVTFNSSTATQAAIQALLRNIGFENSSDDPVAGIRTVRITVSDGDGQTSTAVTRNVNVIAVNDEPVIGLPGGALNIAEGAPAVVIDPTASVIDPDSHDFDTGTLSVFVASGADSGDVIAIQNQGAGTGQVGVIAATSQVTYSGVVIGAFTGGTGGTPLVITFNAASGPTPESIQAVARAITFQNVSENPPANTRPLRFVATDGDGGTSSNIQITVTIAPANDLPVIAPTRVGISYTENDAPALIDSGMTLTDPDSPDFNNGTLIVDYAAGGAAEDRLGVRNQGTGVGQIGTTGLNGQNVTYNFGTGPVIIGAITSAGIGTTKLQIAFNPNASLVAVEALLQNITYFNASDNPSTVQRTARFVLNDGDGGSSAPVLFTIDIGAVNDGPTITGVSGVLPYTAGSPAKLIAPAATVADPDSSNFATGNLTISILSGLANDVLAIRNQGAGAGRIGVTGSTVTFGGAAIGTFSGGTAGNPLVITFNSTAATPAAVSALAANITFRTPNGTGVDGVRTVTFTARDFAGGMISNAPSVNVDVTSTGGPNDDFYETNEDVVLSVTQANGVLANDPNPSQLTANTTPVVAPTKGTLSLNADGSFQYLPTLDLNGTDSFTYQWTNSSMGTSGTAVVTVIVNPVNDAPTAQLSANTRTANEDSGAFSENAFAIVEPGGGTDEDAQVVTRTVTNSNNALFANQPAIDAAGRLTFSTANNANGSATVTLMLQDDGGTFGSVLDRDTASVTFTVVVTAVNDLPTFQISGTPPTVAEDAGAQTVPAFAFNFVPGPANESSQTQTYLLTAIGTSGGLTFAVAPSINAAGDLTYTAAPNSTGTASFIAQVRDSGGTANGGFDLSAPRNFTITVSPIDDAPTLAPDAATVLWNSSPNPIDVLANDSGAPDAGDNVTVSAVTQGTNGSVAIQPGGTGLTYQPAPGFVGTDTFQYTGSDAQGNAATTMVTINVIRVNTQAVDIVALGSGVGGSSQVRIFNVSTGQFVTGFAAFDPSFQGGINVATGDVNGDGATDVIIGAGVGGAPRVMIVDGTRFGLLKGVNQIADPSALLQNFFVYDFHFTGGVTVAAGDVNGDGRADVIVGTGPGGGPHVKIISGARIDRIGPDGLPDNSALLAGFFAFDSNFRGGVNVAAGDVNGDGFADVLTAAGAGGGSHVKAYNGRTLVESGPLASGVLLASFYAFDPNFRGGVNVAAGDFNGDGFAEYIVGAGQGGGSHVKVFSPFNLATPIASFFAFGSSFGGGVDVGYRARSGGASPLLLTGTGVGTSARFVAFAPPSFTAVVNIEAFDPGFTGGVEVG